MSDELKTIPRRGFNWADSRAERVLCLWEKDNSQPWGYSGRRAELRDAIAVALERADGSGKPKPFTGAVHV